MMAFNPLLVVVLLFSLDGSLGNIVRRFNYDAVIFEEYNMETRNVMYSQSDKEEWKNLGGLMKSLNFRHKAMLCTRGRGAWWSFPGVNYNIGSGLSYHLILGEMCMPANEIQSLQPIGIMQNRMPDALVLYSKPHFGSEQRVLTTGSITMDVQSLVFIGNRQWVIEAEGVDGSSVRVCLYRGHHENMLCILPVLDSTIGLNSGIKRIRETMDCSNEYNVHRLEVQSCYPNGVHAIQFDHDFSLTNMYSLCDASEGIYLPDSFKNKFVKIMEIWEGRMIGQLEDQDTVAVPNAAIFKFKLLWNVVDVFKTECPHVSPEYLSLLRNVFIQHIRDVWEHNPETIGVNDEEFKYSSDFIDTCYSSMNSQVPLGEVDSRMKLVVPCMAMDTGDLKFEKEKDALDEMLEGGNYDTVIEHIWLIHNFVLSYCNSVNRFRGNEWADLVTTFRKHYLIPLQKRWRRPGVWAKSYVTMFNGYNLNIERKHIINCIDAALLKTAHYDPVGRTNIFSQQLKPVNKEALRFKSLSRNVDHFDGRMFEPEYYEHPQNDTEDGIPLHWLKSTFNN